MAEICHRGRRVPVRRPRSSILLDTKSARLGLPPNRSWRDALGWYLDKRSTANRGRTVERLVTGGGLRIAIVGSRGIPACWTGFETFAEELLRAWWSWDTM